MNRLTSSSALVTDQIRVRCQPSGNICLQRDGLYPHKCNQTRQTRQSSYVSPITVMEEVQGLGQDRP